MNYMWKVLAVTGACVGAFMLYKKQNPECVEDMKESLNKMTKTAGKSMKNMME
ncbi:MAG: hypothetical protein IJ568_06665 [Bacilli bacterium]|nr:hypothetical protein [Bacilli bacterium]